MLHLPFEGGKTFEGLFESRIFIYVCTISYQHKISLTAVTRPHTSHHYRQGYKKVQHILAMPT